MVGCSVVLGGGRGGHDDGGLDRRDTRGDLQEQRGSPTSHLSSERYRDHSPGPGLSGQGLLSNIHHHRQQSAHSAIWLCCRYKNIESCNTVLRVLAPITQLEHTTDILGSVGPWPWVRNA